MGARVRQYGAVKSKYDARKAYPRRYKQRGEWVELLFMARAAQLGLKVAKPHGDSGAFDAIVEGAGELHRVQVKSTVVLRKDCYVCDCSFGSYQAGNGSRGVKHGGPHTWRITHKSYSPDEVDFVAAYIIPEDTWFIVPLGAIAARTMLLPAKTRSRPSRYDSYREAWHLLGVDDKSLTIFASAVDGELIAFLRKKIAEQMLPQE